MELLLLKERDFGLQKRTGPSSGIVASIVLVSPGLKSLAEVCGGVTCGSLVIRDHWTTFQKSELLLFKIIIKNRNFVIKIIFISLESSCFNLGSTLKFFFFLLKKKTTKKLFKKI